MNTNEKELYRFLGVAEKMSGYDGMDYFEGDLSSFDDFDGDDFDSYDGMSFASGNAPAQNVWAAEPVGAAGGGGGGTKVKLAVETPRFDDPW